MSGTFEELHCPNRESHTPCPEGYMQWHAWAAKMQRYC
jgi:hypothetical protein